MDIISRYFKPEIARFINYIIRVDKHVSIPFACLKGKYAVFFPVVLFYLFLFIIYLFFFFFATVLSSSSFGN
jgi:hypothetical protein